MGIRLTWVSNKAYTGFKKFIAGKVHYLGRDRLEAEKKALALMLAATGQTPAEGPTPPPVAPTGPTVGEVFEAFIEEVEKSATFSNSWRHAVRYRSGEVTPLLPLKRPMKALTVEDLASAVNEILSLPVGKRGVPIRPMTALQRVKMLRQVIGWALDRGYWDGPARWERVFRTRGRLASKRLIASQTRRMTMEELATVWPHLTPHLRCVVLVMLNTAQTQTEIATIRRDEVDLERGRITRLRQKTGTPADWKLWPETIAALREHMARTGDLALVNSDGGPLCYCAERNRVDNVDQQWRRAWGRAGVDKGSPGPGRLRKLSADVCYSVSDLDTVQKLLAHVPSTVAEIHYLRPDFSRLDKAIDLMRKKFLPIISPAITRKRSVA